MDRSAWESASPATHAFEKLDGSAGGEIEATVYTDDAEYSTRRTADWDEPRGWPPLPMAADLSTAANTPILHNAAVAKSAQTDPTRCHRTIHRIGRRGRGTFVDRRTGSPDKPAGRCCRMRRNPSCPAKRYHDRMPSETVRCLAWTSGGATGARGPDVWAVILRSCHDPLRDLLTGSERTHADCAPRHRALPVRTGTRGGSPDSYRSSGLKFPWLASLRCRERAGTLVSMVDRDTAILVIGRSLLEMRHTGCPSDER